MIRQLKPATKHDMTVGGADLAGQAIKAGLIDERVPAQIAQIRITGRTPSEQIVA